MRVALSGAHEEVFEECGLQRQRYLSATAYGVEQRKEDESKSWGPVRKYIESGGERRDRGQ